MWLIAREEVEYACQPDKNQNDAHLRDKKRDRERVDVGT